MLLSPHIEIHEGNVMHRYVNLKLKYNFNFSNFMFTSSKNFVENNKNEWGAVPIMQLCHVALHVSIISTRNVSN